jgi:hypothetical protein
MKPVPPMTRTFIPPDYFVQIPPLQIPVRITALDLVLMAQHLKI